MIKITKVKRGSLAKELGLQKGDIITHINGYDCVNELDYIYYSEKNNFTLKVKDEEKEALIEVEKEEGEDLGIEIEPISKMRTCHNNCVFCFVDQMPPNMRESLYIKDDDYSMSFSCGNFVTMTNMKDEDIDRVIRLNLSPLYVSVQTMNAELRCKLLNNRFAGKIKEQLKKLTEAGIQIHCQAVIVPNVSDGKELEYTARELFKMYPNIKDLAVVPTGITKYREGLYHIDDIDKRSSEELLELVDRLNSEFKVNFILPADEYYIRAEKPFKNEEFYGDYEQIENGIGMTVKFKSEFYSALKKTSLSKIKRSLTVCGVSAEGITREITQSANDNIENLRADVLAVKNGFFGESVTCTGLLTGGDVLNALKAHSGEYDEVVIPSNMLKEFEDVFLDGMSLSELKKKLKFKNIRVNYNGGEGYFNILSTLK